MKGYGGRLLFVDLGGGATRVETLPEPMARAFLGGNGVAARLLYDHVPAGVDAFDPRNAVVFAVGPITDTSVPGKANTGHAFGAELCPDTSGLDPVADRAEIQKRLLDSRVGDLLAYLKTL